MVTLGWFVCPSVSMVTMSRTTGLVKTLDNQKSWKLAVKELTGSWGYLAGRWEGSHSLFS